MLCHKYCNAILGQNALLLVLQNYCRSVTRQILQNIAKRRPGTTPPLSMYDRVYIGHIPGFHGQMDIIIIGGLMVTLITRIFKYNSKNAKYLILVSCISQFFCWANITIHLKERTLFRSGLCVSCQCVSQAFPHLASHPHSGDIARRVLLPPLSRTFANVRKMQIDSIFYEAFVVLILHE